MFKKLTKFDYQRETKEALGFYIFYFVFITLLSGVAGFFMSFIPEFTSYDIYLITTFMAGLITSILSFLLIRKKRLPLAFLLLGVLSGGLGLLGGALLGMIIPAYLTTCKKE